MATNSNVEFWRLVSGWNDGAREALFRMMENRRISGSETNDKYVESFVKEASKDYVRDNPEVSRECEKIGKSLIGCFVALDVTIFDKFCVGFVEYIVNNDALPFVLEFIADAEGLLEKANKVIKETA
jgi:hypothetical protein